MFEILETYVALEPTYVRPGRPGLQGSRRAVRRTERVTLTDRIRCRSQEVEAVSHERLHNINRNFEKLSSFTNRANEKTDLPSIQWTYQQPLWSPLTQSRNRRLTTTATLEG